MSSIQQFEDMLSTHVVRSRSRCWYDYFEKAYPEAAEHITRMNVTLAQTYGDLVSFGVMYLGDEEPGATSALLHLTFATPDGIENAGSWEISEERLSWSNYPTGDTYPREAKIRQGRERRERFLSRLNQHVMSHVAEAGLKPLAKRQ